MGEGGLLGCMSYDVMGNVSTSRMQLEEHFLPAPTGVPASILLDECRAMASVLLQNLRSQRHGVKERTEAMPLCCKQKLSSKLAENCGLRASCVYSVLSALHLKLGH